MFHEARRFHYGLKQLRSDFIRSKTVLNVAKWLSVRNVRLSLICEEYAPELNLSEICARAYLIYVRSIRQSLISEEYRPKPNPSEVCARAYSVRRMQQSLICQKYVPEPNLSEVCARA